MSKARLLHYLICGLIISYWFNVTIIETGLFGGVNEFKLYDFLGLPLLVLTFSNYPVRKLFKQDLIYKKLYYFILWCSLTGIFTIIFSVIVQSYDYTGMTVIYLYHFWTFFITGLLILLSDRNKLMVYIQLFIFMAFVQTVIIWLQVGGVIGHLIKYRYFEDMYTGMVGPNRIVPGMMCNLGGALSLFVLLKRELSNRLSFIIKVFALGNVFLWVPTLIMTTSRTSMVFFAIMIIIWITLFARKYVLLLLLLLPLLLIAYSNLGEKARKRIDSTLTYNEAKFKKASQNDPEGIMDYYYEMGNGRYQIMMRTVKFMADNPHMLFLGKGFNNRIYSMNQYGSLTPHNMYLNMLLEGGIVSFILYFGWLYAYLKYFISISRIKEYKIVAGLYMAFIIAMLVSLFGGEHLYVYRAHYAIMGAFLAIMSMGVSSLELLNDNKISQCSEEEYCGE